MKGISTMGTLTIFIDLSGDAFADDPATEVSRILHVLAGRMPDVMGGGHVTVRDENGNTCGTITLVD